MTSALRNQIILTVRFSYLSKTGFTREVPAGMTRQAFLYDPARLERRFRLFEALTVPALCGQSDAEFTCLLVTGQDLPGAARQRLEGLLAPLRDLRIVALPPMHHYPAMCRAIDQCRDPAASHVTTVRLDDDDALGLDYIARLRRIATALADVSEKRDAVVIAFNNGFFLEQGCDSTQVYNVREKLPLGAGLALMAPADCADNIYARNHRLLPMFYDSFCEANTPMFIRSVHADNDSEPHLTGRREAMPDNEIDAILKARFGQSLARLATL